jgi:tetratricopeptide (TPR) repeat protein
MVVLGLLTQSLIGQGSYEEAIKVGVPLLELAGTPAWELSDQMGGIIVKNMADYLLEKKDYAGAVRVWEAGVKCQPGDVNALLELSRCLILANDKTGARRQLAQAQAIVPQNEDVLTMLNQVALSPVLHRPSSAVRRQKKRI